MWRIRELKICFIFFYLFSQTSYIPLSIDRTKQLKIGSIILKIFQFCLPIIQLVVDANLGYVGSSPKNFNQFVLQLILYLHFIGSYYIFYNSIFPSVKSNHICEFITAIIQYVELKLNISIQIDKFRRKYLRKLLITLALQAISLIVTSAFGRFFIIPYQLIYIIIIYSTKIIAAFYAVFFVDLVTYLLKSINKAIKEISGDPRKKKKIFATLRHLKWIHYNLFKFSKLINDRFGSMIIICLLENFVNCYVFIFLCVVKWPSIGIASKQNL